MAFLFSNLTSTVMTCNGPHGPSKKKGWTPLVMKVGAPGGNKNLGFFVGIPVRKTVDIGIKQEASLPNL